MKKQILILATYMPLVSCGSANTNSEIKYEFPQCGTSQLNGKVITKVCATRDLTAPRTYKDYTPEFIKIIFGAGHAGYGSSTPNEGAILGFENQELDMQGHVWDFSKQGFPVVELRGHDTIIQNGILLKTYLSLGGNYISPNFSTGEQKNNVNIDKDGFLYAKGQNSEAYNGSIENFYLKNIKNYSDTLALNSWGGGIALSKFIIEKYIYIEGSKVTITGNQIIGKTERFNKKSLFNLQKQKNSTLIDSSKQIFPDHIDDKTTIPNILYIKFSPDTVIDGNSFTLTHKNDQAYAIVLDHSPRVRISNNTFNGFKVPILMDQWSSIVDENGKEIKPEQFTGYGNVINLNTFAGDVTMNRKGEIVKKLWYQRLFSRRQ